MGLLAVSRAIGDHSLRPYVIAEPEVTIINRHPDDELLVMASDGLWDVMTNQEACTLAKKCLQRARQRGSTRQVRQRCSVPVAAHCLALPLLLVCCLPGLVLQPAGSMVAAMSAHLAVKQIVVAGGGLGDVSAGQGRSCPACERSPLQGTQLWGNASPRAHAQHPVQHSLPATTRSWRRWALTQSLLPSCPPHSGCAERRTRGCHSAHPGSSRPRQPGQRNRGDSGPLRRLRGRTGSRGSGAAKI